MVVPIVGSLVTFIVALLIGGLAIFVSAAVITGERSYPHAVITALIGAIAWALTSWIPIIGPFIALFVWIWVINWRYAGGWWKAIGIGIVAWLVVLGILSLLNSILRLGVGAVGIPGV